MYKQVESGSVVVVYLFLFLANSLMAHSLLDYFGAHQPEVEEEQEFGKCILKNNTVNTTSDKLDEEYEKYVQSLNEIKLTGFKYLKPPGVPKTLKNYHEEEEYAQESTGFEYSFDTNTNMNMNTIIHSGSEGGSLSNENDDSPVGLRPPITDSDVEDSLTAGNFSLNASFSQLFNQEDFHL